MRFVQWLLIAGVLLFVQAGSAQQEQGFQQQNFLEDGRELSVLFGEVRPSLSLPQFVDASLAKEASAEVSWIHNFGDTSATDRVFAQAVRGNELWAFSARGVYVLDRISGGILKYWPVLIDGQRPVIGALAIDDLGNVYVGSGYKNTFRIGGFEIKNVDPKGKMNAIVIMITNGLLAKFAEVGTNSDISITHIAAYGDPVVAAGGPLGDKDFFIARFDLNARHLWLRGTTERTGVAVLNDVEVSAVDSSVSFTASIQGKVEFASRLFESRGSYDGLAATLRANGSLRCVIQFGGPNADNLLGVDVNHAHGALLLAGYAGTGAMFTDNSRDTTRFSLSGAPYAFLARTDSLGRRYFAKTDSLGVYRDAVFDKNGRTYAFGDRQMDQAGNNYDLVLACYDNVREGKLLWRQQFVAPGKQFAGGIVRYAGTPEVIYLNALFTDQLRLYGRSISSNGGWDGAIVALPTASLTTSVSESVGDVPVTFELRQNYPNPFNPNTNIRYSLSTNESAVLLIYDLQGRQVLKAELPRVAGSGLFTWDGRDSFGVAAASGVYIYELRAGDWSEKRKMTLVR